MHNMHKREKGKKIRGKTVFKKAKAVERNTLHNLIKQ